MFNSETNVVLWWIIGFATRLMSGYEEVSLIQISRGLIRLLLIWIQKHANHYCGISWGLTLNNSNQTLTLSMNASFWSLQVSSIAETHYYEIVKWKIRFFYLILFFTCESRLSHFFSHKLWKFTCYCSLMNLSYKSEQKILYEKKYCKQSF